MHITRIIPFTTLLMAALALLAACAGGDATNAASTPAGLLEGKPTFVYLWNTP